jgi:hypothetical protein
LQIAAYACHKPNKSNPEMRVLFIDSCVMMVYRIHPDGRVECICCPPFVPPYTMLAASYWKHHLKLHPTCNCGSNPPALAPVLPTPPALAPVLPTPDYQKQIIDLEVKVSVLVLCPNFFLPDTLCILE